VISRSGPVIADYSVIKGLDYVYMFAHSMRILLLGARQKSLYVVVDRDSVAQVSIIW
jgi:hypothetical protein